MNLRVMQRLGLDTSMIKRLMGRKGYLFDAKGQQSDMDECALKSLPKNVYKIPRKSNFHIFHCLQKKIEILGTYYFSK
jgi:hypothetical protein